MTDLRSDWDDEPDEKVPPASDTAPAEPAPSDADSTDPAAADAEPNEPTASDAEPSEPTASDADPAEPAVSDAETAEPVESAALAAITAAAAGLLVMSESDHPLEPFQWPGTDPISTEALLEYLQLPPDTPVETRSLESFFDPLAQDRDWFDDEQRATAARFAELRDLIAECLTDVTVYRVGKTRITVFIVGRDASDAQVGLRTMLIET